MMSHPVLYTRHIHVGGGGRGQLHNMTRTQCTGARVRASVQQNLHALVSCVGGHFEFKWYNLIILHVSSVCSSHPPPPRRCSSKGYSFNGAKCCTEKERQKPWAPIVRAHKTRCAYPVQCPGERSPKRDLCYWLGFYLHFNVAYKRARANIFMWRWQTTHMYTTHTRLTHDHHHQQRDQTASRRPRVLNTTQSTVPSCCWF